MTTQYVVLLTYKQKKHKPVRFNEKEDALVYAKNSAKRLNPDNVIEVVKIVTESLGVLRGQLEDKKEMR